MLGLWHDFEVALDCDASRITAKLQDKRGERGAYGHLGRFAVQKDLHLALHAGGLALQHVPAQDARTMTKPIYVLNGPNLNLLGQREPDIYGSATLDDIHKRMAARHPGVALETRQSNHEGELVDWIQEGARDGDAIILNAGAYTHTSVALHDALRACSIPVIEVHLSNPAAREEFRHKNFVAPVANATVAGVGAFGYELALDAALNLIASGGR